MKKQLLILIISLILLTLIIEPSFANERPKIGLVLSGGGAKGIAHIGVIKVLEEYGIRPDYISGTSMGSIIGALYAIGYTPEEMESIVLSQDWPALMSGHRERVNLSLLELENDSKYQLDFPLAHGRLELHTGLVNGQNIIDLLSTLTVPAHDVEDFNKLPIPFCCIGTDLETGNEIVMDHGRISEAIRASMSIPTVFSPSEWEEYILLDGGLVNNFPVEAVRNMGAEIIIGVDISQSFAKREDLKNLVSIITQAISFRGYASTEEQRKYCDILISPNLEGYNLLSFDKLDDIYNIGEYSARQHSAELQALSNMLSEYQTKPIQVLDTKKTEFLVRKIQVKGLKTIPKYAVTGWLNINTPSVVGTEQIESSIQRLISSSNFEFVHYRLLKRPRGDGYTLEISLDEKSNDSVKIGGNFNTEDYASILVKLNYQNTFNLGSSNSLTARLNPKAEIDLTHRFLSGWDYGVGIFARASLYINDTYKYEDNYKVGETRRIDNLAFEGGPTLLIGNKAMISLLLRHDMINLMGDVKESDYLYDDHMDKVYLSFFRDFLDDRFFPTRGAWGYFAIENAFHNGFKGEVDDYVQKFVWTALKAFPLSRNLSFKVGLNLGLSSKNNSKMNNNIFLGGNRLIDHTTFPFPGMKPKSMSGQNAYVLSAGLQYSFKEFFFLTLNGYYAEVNDDIESLLKQDGDMYAGSVDLGMRTPLGPIEVSMQKNSYNNQITGYVNIGYKY